MEESLLTLPKEENDLIKISNSSSLMRAYFFEEVKRQCYIAGPMVAVMLSQNLLCAVSMMMVGHLGELALSSASIAISLSNVTGFSVFIGMASGLETICGQAYGAKQYQKVGLQTYTAIVSINLVCLPLSLLWIYMEDMLIFMGQNPQISCEAGKFTIWLIPSLFAYATLQPLIKYFQTQSLITPMLLSSCVTLLLHIPLCWVLVFKSGLDNIGGALAISISDWLNVIMLVSYMKYSSTCSLTRAPFTKEVFHGMREFFYFSIPSTIMICVEWWAFELLILLSGILPNPALESSVLSVCLQTISTLYAIPYGFGAAASTRVANELGAGNSEGARKAAQVAVLLAFTETSIETTTLFALRHSYGYTFSNEKQVIDYVTSMAPLVCLTLALDSFQGVLTGIARGCGWQHIGAYINIGAFYLCGIPVAAILAFWLELRGRGLWIGVQLGSLVQTIFLSFVTTCTNWEMQVLKGPNMEEGLLLPEGKDQAEQRKWSTGSTTSLTWFSFLEEVKRLGCIAAPMVVVILSRYLVQVASTMMVGHLGELALSSTAIATSLATVTAFSLLLGMASALETLCGQAYGAEQYQKFGLQTYTAIFSLSLVCIPICPMALCGRLVDFPGYFQAQSLILPMLLSSCAALLIHIPLCWVLVFKSGMNNLGGALAMSISYWLNAIFLGLYMKFSTTCSKTRAPFSKEVFQGIGEFFSFAVPSAIMICLQWWSFEVLILLCGLLPNPALETSLLSVCLQTISTLYSIPYGFGAAASTRVSNELGAGNPQGARIATFAAIFLAALETSTVATILFCCRYVFGYLFSNEEEVVDYVRTMAPLVCLSVILDSFQGILSGIARGCGWQHIGAYINLGAFYLCGIPVAATLGFWLQLRGRGLWIGIQVGAFVQVTLLAFVTTCTNWEKQARSARERIFEGSTPVDKRLDLLD